MDILFIIIYSLYYIAYSATALATENKCEDKPDESHANKVISSLMIILGICTLVYTIVIITYLKNNTSINTKNHHKNVLTIIFGVSTILGFALFVTYTKDTVECGSYKNENLRVLSGFMNSVYIMLVIIGIVEIIIS